MSIDKQTAERIKQSANVTDVLGDFLTLHKKGVNYQALCPFHSDRHLGSFIINPRKNTWNCYSCGKGGDVIDFLELHEHMRYPDALRWLARKYNITIPGEDSNANWQHLPSPSKPHQAPPPLPIVEMPIQYATSKMHTEGDTFCQWLRSLPWNAEQRTRLETTLRLYLVGHSKTGHTIFWQLDENGKLRTGHMMLYKSDGHRDKSKGNSNTWIHYLLRHPKDAKGNPLPPMLADEDHADIDYQLFGMHILDMAPGATVNIVESEKTALLATTYWGNQKHFIWMACNGLAWLKRDRLEPIIKEGRKIVLFPDRDGVEKWKEKASELDYDRLSINTTYLDRFWQPEDGEKADIGDIILRALRKGIKPYVPTIHSPTPSKPPKEQATEALENMIQRNPNIKTLVDKLQLEPIRITKYE